MHIDIKRRSGVFQFYEEKQQAVKYRFFHLSFG